MIEKSINRILCFSVILIIISIIIPFFAIGGDEFPLKGSIVFSSLPFKKGSSPEPVSVFLYTSKIYAKAVVSTPFGKIGKEEGFIDIYIDNVFKRRYTFGDTDVKMGQSEFLLYIFNTGEDDVERSFFTALTAGEHMVKINMGICSVADDRNPREKLLSTGSFSISKP